jgi:hypothetical protein
MKRNEFVLPSERMTYVQHDCRLGTVKYRTRNKLYDLTSLTHLLAKTKSSLNIFYDSYLKHPNDEMNTLKKQTNTSLLDSRSLRSETSLNIKLKAKENNKELCQSIVNQNDVSYGNLIWPSAFCTSFNNEVVVVDSYEHRVLVFNRNFLFKYKFGHIGSSHGEFNEPVDAIINELGVLYVADKNNMRIQMFKEARPNRIKINLRSALASRNNHSQQSALTKILRRNQEYEFYDLITLNDKPIKLCASALASVVAVSTEQGFVYIINENNQVSSYLKLKKPFELSDLRLTFLDEYGDTFTYLKTYRDTEELCLKTYKTELLDTDFSKNQPRKMTLTRKINLQQNYYPGICLTKISCIRLSLDFKKIVLFDTININLLEYDLNGNFLRIILKAENHLGNVLSFDLSGDRQHLITSECSIDHSLSRRRGHNEFDNKSARLNLSNQNFVFKLKCYMHTDCECHRHLNSSKLSKSPSKSPIKFEDLDEDEFELNY